MDDRLELRKYSVLEIDALRAACRRKVETGRYREPDIHNLGDEVVINVPLTFSATYRRSGPVDWQRVEEMARTHMLAGHTAEDLLASETASAPSGSDRYVVHDYAPAD